MSILWAYSNRETVLVFILSPASGLCLKQSYYNNCLYNYFDQIFVPIFETRFTTMKPQLISGIHHVTAMADNAQKNLDFYTGILGLRMVKKTINFDAPDVYHFYYGNETGSPGTIMTFFPLREWPKAGMAKGR